MGARIVVIQAQAGTGVQQATGTVSGTCHGDHPSGRQDDDMLAHDAMDCPLLRSQQSENSGVNGSTGKL